GRPVQHLLQSDCALGPPAEVHRVRMGPDRVYWTPGHNGEQYDVARGDIALLKAEGLLECVVIETAMTSWPDTEMPLPGEVIGYMVRPTNVCGVGEWGRGTNNTARAAVCP
ncbi:MAG: hypothetical protein OES25_17455, partial [Acidobacteriota bacterium]|nr:hypothetical protein [Acidobacteriota bacterium]